MVSPCIPRDSASPPLAPTTRWMWLASTENAQTRNPRRSQPATRAALSAAKQRGERREAISALTFIEMWTG
jgi:hypothetical protein